MAFNAMSFAVLATCDTSEAALFTDFPALPGLPS
jgi:hypothetical protein